MSKTNDRQDNHLSPNKDQGEKNKTNGRSPNLYKDLSYFNATFLQHGRMLLTKDVEEQTFGWDTEGSLFEEEF